MNTKPYNDTFLVKAAGAAILIMALVKIPQVISAMAQILYFLISGTSGDQASATEQIAARLQQTVMATAIRDIIAFVLLLLLARWMFGFPKFMKSAFQRTDISSNARAAESAEL